MIAYFSKQNRSLLSELVRTDFKLRYQGSVLGYAWSLLRPLLMFVILYVVFTKFLRIGSDIKNYPIYLLLGIVLWNFFHEMTTQGLSSIVDRGDLIRKIMIPRWIIVFSSSISALINLGLNMIVIATFLVLSGVGFTVNVVWMPLIVFEIYIFGLGLSLLLSTLFVKFRDIRYIWEVIMQAGFYLTPILYPLTLIHSIEFQKLLLLNPMAQAVQDARFALVNQEQTITIQRVFDGGPYAYIPFLLVALIGVAGVWYFRKRSKYFAEDV